MIKHKVFKLTAIVLVAILAAITCTCYSTRATTYIPVYRTIENAAARYHQERSTAPKRIEDIEEIMTKDELKILNNTRKAIKLEVSILATSDRKLIFEYRGEQLGPFTIKRQITLP